MPNVRTLATSFNGGEITPEFYGQLTDVKRQTGLALCKNMLVLPHGPVANRGGTKFVRAAKYPDRTCALVDFIYSDDQSFAIEVGDGYMRFHTLGATLLPGSVTAWSNATAYTVGDLAASAGVNYYCILAHTNQAPPNATYWYALPSSGEYEIPSPYADEHALALNYVQSEDVLTITHPLYAPRELRRLGAAKWVISTISFASDLAAPSGVTATATVATGTGLVIMSYKVTAVNADGKEESLASSEATCSNNLLTTGNKNTVTWSSVTGAVRYNVYLQDNGLYGFIGQTDGTSFVDDNIDPDLSKTPPILNTPFSTDWPKAVSYSGQRRIFAGTPLKPSTFWMTRTGTESNLSYSIPSRDDDGISYRISARKANAIRHIVPLQSPLLMTSSSVWVINPDGAAITSSLSLQQQDSVGASDVQPVVANNNAVYAAARGGHLRDVQSTVKTTGFSGGFVSSDLSLRASHLVDGYDISDMAYSETPYPIVWGVRSDGVLLGLTYLPEQQVTAWHQHTTATAAGKSEFLSVCTVPESGEDALYCAVRREVDGDTVVYIERVQNRMFTDREDCFFVDCGLTYDGVATGTISGLDHLEGETVSILANGAVHPQRTVASGSITLDRDYTKVQIGLPITADVQTLPFYSAIEGYGQGRQKNVNAAWVRVDQSSGIFAGPDFEHLTEYKQRTTEPYGSPPSLASKELKITVSPSWGDGGQLCIRQPDPLPLTITAMSMEVAIGG